MKKVTVALRGVVGAALFAGSSGVTPAGAQAAFGPVVNKPTPALAEFDRTLGGVRDYTTTIVVFEQLNDGSRVSTSTYAYKVLKPAAAVAAVVDGPRKGMLVAWNGGDTVAMRRSGALSPIKLTVAIDDPRVQSIRGDTIDTGTFGYELRYMLATPGTLAEAAGPSIDGEATTAVTLKIKDPAVAAITKVELDLATASHLPLRRRLYVGSTVVKTETFGSTKINVGLRPQDIAV